MSAFETAMTPHLLEQAGVVADGDQYADSTALTLDVESIIVTDRYRKEIGDVSDLKASIANVGLLNPITVREWHGGHRLVAGERRLTAFKQMGLTEIPARVARDIADARDALVAERDENTARKPMLPSEATALGMAIEDMERSNNRPGFRSDVHGTSGSRDPEVRPRDIAAEAIGMGEPTYRRMKALVTAAADVDATEDVREAARVAVDEIDSGAPVRANYEKVRALRSTPDAKPRANDRTEYHLALAALHPTCRIAFEKDARSTYSSLDTFAAAARKAGAEWRFTEKQWITRTEQSRDILDRSTLGIEVALDAIGERVDMTTITSEQATEALERLNSRALNRIIKQLQEISNV